MADRKLRTVEDLERVIRTLAREFQAEEVFIVGSQAILASMPDAQSSFSTSRVAFRYSPVTRSST